MVTPDKGLMKGKDAKALTPEEIAEFQGMLARIASRESKGWIYMCEPDAGHEGEANGILFTHHLGADTVMKDLVEKLEMDKEAVKLLILTLITSMKN